MKQKPTIHGTKPLSHSRIFEIESVDLTFSNGENRQYERLKAKIIDAVMVVAIDKNDLILVREYAVGVEDYLLGFPKGLVDPGEDTLQAANRELQEEAGFGANKLEYLTHLTMNPGYSSMSTHVVKATDLFESSLPGDEPEPLEVVRWPMSKLDELLLRDDFSEARSIAALMFLK